MNFQHLTAYCGEDPYIFVSYAHSDSDIVLPIVEKLQNEGFRIWFDNGIEAGTEWPETIAEHIEKCRCVLAFITPAAADSHNCRREINFAVEEKKDLLAVHLEDFKTSAGMRMQLNTLQSIYRSRFLDDSSFLGELMKARMLEDCRGEAVCAADERHMSGKVYDDGSYYEGESVNFLPDGYGVMHYADGNVYEGEFSQGKRHGKGTVRSPKGSSYTGHWRNDLPNGDGIRRFSSGEVTEGYFINGMIRGIGKRTYEDGSVYEGNFVDDMPMGKGKFTDVNGDVYEGEFKMGDLMDGIRCDSRGKVIEKYKDGLPKKFLF